jgi:hypothetical protein
VKRQEARTELTQHSEGKVKEPSTKRWSQVNCEGEGPLCGDSIINVNRKDTSTQALTGGPVILNKGENIFTVRKGRPVGMGQTLRANEYPEGVKEP